MKNFFKNSLLVVASVLVTLVFAEIAVQVYSYFFYPKMMQFDETLGWSHKPSAKKIFVNEDGDHALVIQNRYGQRGREYPFARNGKKTRILVIGDSFTEGVQVGESQLFTHLMEKNNKKLEVLNAGVGAYSTVQEYLYLKNTGLKFKPDIVLYMFYNNDLFENCLSYSPAMGPRPYAVVEGNSTRVVEALNDADYLRFALPAPFAMTLQKYSLLYAFLNTRVYQKIFARPLKQEYKADLNKLEKNCHEKKVFSDLVRLEKSISEKAGAEYYVVVIPAARELARKFSNVDRTVSEILKTDGIEHLRLLPVFKQEKAAGARLYFNKDIHWTRAGHRLAAREILKFLKPRIGRANNAPH